MVQKRVSSDLQNHIPTASLSRLHTEVTANLTSSSQDSVIHKQSFFLKKCTAFTVGMILVVGAVYLSSRFKDEVFAELFREIGIINRVYADVPYLQSGYAPSYSQGSYGGSYSQSSYGGGYSQGSYGGGGYSQSSYGGGGYSQSSYGNAYSQGSYSGGGGATVACSNGATFVDNGNGTYTRIGPDGTRSIVSENYVNNAINPATGSYPSTKGYTSGYTGSYCSTSGYTKGYTSGYTGSYCSTSGYTKGYTSGYTGSYCSTSGYTKGYTSGYTGSYCSTSGYTKGYTSGYTCFTAGTLVSTHDGLVPIESIQPGVKVISYDERADSFATSTVGQVIVHTEGLNANNFSEQPLLRVSIKDKKGVTATEVTSNHPYYDVSRKEYRAIGEFKVGDRVRTQDGEGVFESIEVVIDGTEKFERTSATVYNLHMSEGPHNYLANGVVVHNKR
jgi:hypothetical protein